MNYEQNPNINSNHNPTSNIHKGGNEGGKVERKAKKIIRSVPHNNVLWFNHLFILNPVQQAIVGNYFNEHQSIHREMHVVGTFFNRAHFSSFLRTVKRN